MLSTTAKNYLIYLASPVTRAIASFLILIPITTYFLEPKDFGIYAAIVAITNLVPALSMIGPSWVMAAHYFNSDFDQRISMISALALITLVLSIFWAAIFMLAGRIAIGWFIDKTAEELTQFFYVALSAALMNFLWPIASNLLVMERQAVTHAVAELVTFFISVGAIIASLTVLGLGTLSLFIGPAASALATFLISLWVLRQYLRPEAISKRWIDEVVKRGLPALPATLSETGYGSIERLILSLWAGLHELGIYAHSQSYRQVLSWGSKAFNAVFMPEALKRFQRDYATSDLDAIIRPWLGVLAIGTVFTALFAGEVIGFLTHDKFTNAAPFVFLWCIAVILQTYGLPYTQFLLARKKTAFVSLSAIVINLSMIPTVVLLVYIFGIYGAAVSVLVGVLGLQLSRRWFAVRQGCQPIAEKGFLSITVLSFLVFGGVVVLEPGILVKVFLFGVLTIVLAVLLNIASVFPRLRVSIPA